MFTCSQTMANVFYKLLTVTYPSTSSGKDLQKSNNNKKKNCYVNKYIGTTDCVCVCEYVYF